MHADNLDELEQIIPEIKSRKPADGFIMVDPNNFDVKFEINRFMNGNIGKVDRDLAKHQWNALYDEITKLSPVTVFKSVPRQYDMVFAANAGLAVDENFFYLSTMLYGCRRYETEYFEEYLKPYYKLVFNPNCKFVFEGQGDALWHPNRNLLYSGYGQRTDKNAYGHLPSVPRAYLKLVSHFYHLDTCFCPIDEETCLYYPYAFAYESKMLIQAMFPAAIPVPEEMAHEFVCNAVVIGDVIIMPMTRDKLTIKGKKIIQLDMSEFIKSGGACKCLVLEHYHGPRTV